MKKERCLIFSFQGRRGEHGCINKEQSVDSVLLTASPFLVQQRARISENKWEQCCTQRERCGRLDLLLRMGKCSQRGPDCI